MSENNDRQNIEYDAHPVFKSVDQETNKKNLSFLEVISQAFCLLFQLQKEKGLKRATDLLEKNPQSILFAGIVSMIIFFLFCLIASQLVIKHLAS